ncbi:MAG: protein-tyrosine phosphatase family protein [Ktedonobacterales bacterium]
MSTPSTPSKSTQNPHDRDTSDLPVDGALPVESPREIDTESEEQQPALPPELSGKAFLRKGLVRWAASGILRVGYRAWTRIAAHAFPEDTQRAALASAAGIPLPDRLNMSWVTPQLAVGGRIHRDDIHRLAASGVTRVVDTRSEHKDDENALAQEGIGLLYLPTPDTFPLTVEQLEEGSAWINRQIDDKQRVLIHCEHGVGRSVLLTAASLVARGMSAHDALALIQRKRWQAAPNHRQIRRLQEFERAVRGRGD